MNITTSLWTTPAILSDNEDALKNNILLCALSLAYAKKQNVHITMHTDTEGYKILSKFPYDKVYCDIDFLNDFIRDETNLLWAASKSVALENETLGTIHIDNDVFLTKSDCVSEMNFDGYDMICEHIEHTRTYNEKLILRNVITNFNTNHHYACCAGIVGFNTEKAKRTYLDNYRYWLENIDLSGIKTKVCADLILEQVYLYDMIVTKNFKCKSLLGDNRRENNYALSKRAVKMGYQHFCSPQKHNINMINKFKDGLKNLDLKLFDLVEEYLNS